MTIDVARITREGIEASREVPDENELAAELHNWSVYGLVTKYDGPEADARARAGLAPDGYAESIGNLLTTQGLDKMTKLLTNTGSPQAFDNTHTRIGVGDTNTAAVIGDTDLKAAANAANRQFELMQATYPTQANGVITARSVFTTGEANFAWAEWGIDQGTTTSITVVPAFLNRKVTSLGTKTSASAWTFTVTLTLS